MTGGAWRMWVWRHFTSVADERFRCHRQFIKHLNFAVVHNFFSCQSLNAITTVVHERRRVKYTVVGDELLLLNRRHCCAAAEPRPAFRSRLNRFISQWPPTITSGLRMAAPNTRKFSSLNWIDSCLIWSFYRLPPPGYLHGFRTPSFPLLLRYEVM